MKNIEISPSDSIKIDGSCLACRSAMNPFLTVVNEESTVVLEKKLCFSCGYAHFTTLPSQIWFEKFYNSEWDSAGHVPKEKIFRADSSQHPNISTLTKIAPNLDSRVLDVGAGYGHFLQAAKHRGYRNVQGIEPSEHRSQHCRKNLNLDVSTAYVENCLDVFRLGSDSTLFDVIHSNHVLEHVYDIDFALKNFYHMLKPGGVVFFVVPYWLQWESILGMSHFLGHIRHFTPKAFVLLLQRHGFEIQHVDNELSITIIGRKPISNEKIVEKEDLFKPLRISVEQLVEEKIVNEMFGGNIRKFRQNHYQQKFWLATRVNNSTYHDVSNISLVERIKWQTKRCIFRVCNNNEAIRGSGGSLLRIFDVKLVLIKLLTRALSFDPIELGGLMTSNTNNKPGENSPLVEFAYQSKMGIATIK